MSIFLKSVVFVIAFINCKVTGVDFTLNRDKVLLGSTGTLTMKCDITETDVDNIYLIQIRRLKSTTLSGSNDNDWQTLALMEAGTNESPTLGEDIAAVAATKDYVAGGSWDSDTPASTVLTLSMNMENLVCDDARYYRCELTYKSSITITSIDVKRNATFSAYVKPQVTSLITIKNGVIVDGPSSSNMATVEVGDELQITCTANIGSLPGTIIRWHRTSETSSSDEFIGYQPAPGTFDEGTAISDNQCGYTRIASIRYNTAAADANMCNNLAFECYVTVSGDPYGNSYISENNPRFYTEVTGSSGGQTDNSISTTVKPGDGVTTNSIITTDKNEDSLTAGVIAAMVIASFTVGVLVGVALTLLNLSRKKKKGPTEQSQHQPTTLFRETELNVSSISPNTYETLQNRADTEHRVTYDNLHANTSAAQNSQSQYESLKQGAGTSHTYAGLKYNR